jgi:hypothetical protein
MKATLAMLKGIADALYPVVLGSGYNVCESIRELFMRSWSNAHLSAECTSYLPPREAVRNCRQINGREGVVCAE